jgi:predicted HNH restriction endonuclease
MLEFVAALFLHVAPNERAWATTVVGYLRARRHEFATGDSFRRRFSNSLAYYQILIRTVNAEMTRLVEEDKRESEEEAELDSRTPIHERTYINAQNKPSLTSATHSHETISEGSSVDPIDRPSAYLRSRCPLCFGGNHTDSARAQLIVCIDGNFQIKRIRDKDRRAGYEGVTGSHDPPIISPSTIILSREYLEHWEKKVLATRPEQVSRSGRKRKANETTEDDTADPQEADKVEAGLHAPNSTYDACQQSFIAADEDRIKASTQYFEDTGMMALLCRHDAPIALASLWTAGEKQFYTFALIETLLNHLPQHWRVGILYDIGCQMDRTLKKWNFVPEWIPRLDWGVSIFHAYGHQWACQLWYHPRKSEIWGLSDGEGCERFWSALRKLIPGLRVTGYHRRLFILDLQVEHIDEGKWVGMGKWLQDRVDRTQRRLEEAEKKLGDRSITYLLDQFKAQREYHSQPISRQSQTKGTRAIEQILALTATLDTQKANLNDLVAEGNDLALDNSSASALVQTEWQEKIKSLKVAIKNLQVSIKKKTDELRLSDRASAAELRKLKSDKWVNTQLNLRVLREQLLKKLRARKFELASLDRANSSRILDQRTKAHVEKAVKHRSGGIQETVRKYNERIKQLILLRGKNGIRKDAYVPPLLTMEGLYKLDVDQDIWEDSPGDIADFPGGVVPPWLADPLVKEGIQLSQEVSSCYQELERCKGEHANLRAWFCEEYDAAYDLFLASSDDEVSYFALLRVHELYDWLMMWKKHMVEVPLAENAPSWDNVRVPFALQKHSACRAAAAHRLAHLASKEPHEAHEADDSSDDDDDGELEEDVEAQDTAFFLAIDQAVAITEDN